MKGYAQMQAVQIQVTRNHCLPHCCLAYESWLTICLLFFSADSFTLEMMASLGPGIRCEGVKRTDTGILMASGTAHIPSSHNHQVFETEQTPALNTSFYHGIKINFL